jgi:phospholipid/cholesterol/gamma-HCH transport system ATP-binding protein
MNFHLANQNAGCSPKSLATLRKSRLYSLLRAFSDGGFSFGSFAGMNTRAASEPAAPWPAGVTDGEPVLSFENVRLGFEEGDVLRGLSFSLAHRETKILLGETGSGKTLALKLAAGLLLPDSGRVRVFGRDLASLSDHELHQLRRQFGFVFQEGALFDSLTVGENVAFRMNEERVDYEEVEERVREALRFVELEETTDKLPDELSGGMRRRVAIARALVNRPAIVLYDSPTAGLDPITSQTIITLILRLRDLQSVTSILATHRLQDGFGLASYRFDAGADRVVPVNGGRSTGEAAAPTKFLVLRDGMAYFEGDPHALLESSDPYLKSFFE